MSKIALPMAELKPALIGLGKVLNKKATLPVLSHLKVERTKEGWIALSAYDLDTAATVRLEQPAEGDPCSFLVPYEELHKTAKACGKHDTITLEAAQDSIIIHYPIGQQSAETKVETLPIEDFPSIPRIQGESIPLPDTLRTSIHEAIECSSDDEIRLILNGAYIDVSEAKCHHVVGTNGRILFSSNSFSLPLAQSIVIPSHPFLAWKEFNSDGEWQLKVDTTPSVFQITSRRWRFISKQIEGNYPNWRQVVPDLHGFKTTVTLEEKTLDSIVQIIQRLPEHDQINHTIGLKIQGKAVYLLGRSPTAENWTEIALGFATAKGKDLTIFINRHFFTNGLEFGLNTIEVTDHLCPLRMSSGGRQLIIMPVRAEAVVASAPVEETSETETQPSAAVAPASSMTTVAAPVEPAAEPIPVQVQPAEERTTMVNSTTPPAEGQAPASEIDQVLDFIEDLRESVSTNLIDLKTVTGKLKQVKRDQRATEKEIASFRQTLKTLQGVRL